MIELQLDVLQVCRLLPDGRPGRFMHARIYAKTLFLAVFVIDVCRKILEHQPAYAEHRTD
jgi:hypothetical protein